MNVNDDLRVTYYVFLLSDTEFTVSLVRQDIKQLIWDINQQGLFTYPYPNTSLIMLVKGATRAYKSASETMSETNVPS